MPLGLRLKRGLKILLVCFFLLNVFLIVYSYLTIKQDISLIEKAVLAFKQDISIINTALKRIASIFFTETLWLLIFAVFSLVSINYLLNEYFLERKNALIDELTEIYNRKAMKIWLRKEVKRAERFKHPLSVAIMDLDRFKIYNDTNGHLRGDWLLKTIAKILKENTRETDFVGRYGGEEFIVIFPETGHSNAFQVCERIRNIIGKTHFIGEETLPTKKITISTGLVTFCDTYDEEKMLKTADSLLYEAKEKGRNCIMHKNICEK